MELDSFSRAGFGDLSHAQLEQWFARRSFLETLARLASEQVNALADEAPPLFNEANRLATSRGLRTSYLESNRYWARAKEMDEEARHVRSWHELVVAAGIPQISEVLGQEASEQADDWEICYRLQAPARTLPGESEVQCLGDALILRALRGTIAEWLQQHNLNQDWIAEAIFVCLVSASERNPNHGSFELRYPLSFGFASSSQGKTAFSVSTPWENGLLVRIPDELVNKLRPNLSRPPLWNPLIEGWEE